MKIKTRLYLSACVTIGLITLLIAFSLFFSSGMKKQLEKNRFASELSRKIAELVLVTDEYLAYHYERSAQQWETKYEEISKMVRNEQSDSFRHLQADLESLRGSFLSLESAAQKRYQLGNNDSGKEVKHIRILEERLAGRIRLISNKIMVHAFNISQNTLTQIEDLERKDNATALAVALLLVCLISASSYFTIRKITRPLRGLVESAKIIEKGNFEHQMGVQNLNPDGRPRDEIGELSVSFESMTRKLTQSIEDLQTEVLERKRAEEALKNAHDELEQRVKERTAELQQSNEELADEIEKRSRIEEALSKNEQHLRSLMESAIGFILYRLMVDPKDEYKAHVIFVSPSIEDIMDVPPRENFSEWFKNIHEDDLPSVMTAHKKSAETGVLFDQLMRIYHPGKGEWRWIRCISKPVFDSDGNPAYYNGLMVDITAEKRAKEKLQETKNTLNSILSSATEYAIAATDLEFRIIHYNPAAESIFGYKADEVLGRTVQEMHTREKVAPERFENAIRAVSEHGKYEYDIIDQDSTGKKRFVHSVVMPMSDEKGDGTGYVFFARDVTKIRELQTQLVRSERLAATGQLAASIAHEINSPLQAVTFMLSSMGERWKNEKELIECIRILQGAFQSIRDTVKNLLDLNRPGKDEKQETDVNRVIEKTIDLVRTHLKKSGVKLSPDLSPQIPGLTASPQGLSHVFLNLFNNAIEAMTGISKSNGGETGLIRRREINVITNLGKGHVVIKVADNGPGIPKEDLEHIFDPFYTRKKKMGLGVGLSVCHDIVKSHGGTITAENGPEGGAVFTITLPIENKP